jgi:hypothetical protein
MLCAGLILVGLASQVAQASPMVLSPDVSVNVMRYAPNWDGGAVIAGDLGQAGDANDFTYRHLVQWNLSSMPAASEIDSVILTFTYAAYNAFVGLNLDHVPADGTAAYPDDFNATLSSLGQVVAAGAPDGSLSINVTDQIKADLNAGRTYSGFRFARTGGDDYAFSGRFVHSETLTVTTVPEPATIALLSLGGVLLRRRK